MDKYYVVNLLKDELYENQKELDRTNDKINYLLDEFKGAEELCKIVTERLGLHRVPIKE